jgi:hypothetical protein
MVVSNQEFTQRLSWSKSEFSSRLRLATWVLISRVGLITTINLTNLQAYVIYLVSPFAIFHMSNTNICRLGFELPIVIEQ